MGKILGFLKKEAVFVIAALGAGVSMCLAPPSRAYLDYIDWGTLCLLFSLMAVVAGWQKAGLLRKMADLLTRRVHSPRLLGLSMVLVCFFSSMLVTNDVALITFVPLTIGLFGTQKQGRLIFILTMETVAANLGSLATPVGNPQNLYLYSYYKMSPGAFFAAVLPIALVSLITITVVMLVYRPRGTVEVPQEVEAKVLKGCALRHGVLFLGCLVGVFGLLPKWSIALVVLAALLLWDRELLKEIDYMLLGTFVCFFIFVGNLGSLDPVKHWVGTLLKKDVTVVSALVSQCISNVPAAVMLAPFTGNAAALLAGVNIGGMGTLIASLASLISFRLYSASPGAKKGRYFLVFTLVNFVGLGLGLGLWLLVC